MDLGKEQIEYYALLSGFHPTLPNDELEAILEANNYEWNFIYRFDGVSLIRGEIDPERIIERAAYVKEVGRLIAYYSVENINFAEVAQKLKVFRLKDARVDAIRLKGYSSSLSLSKIEISLAREIEKIGINATTKSKNLVRVIITEGVAIFGLLLSKKKGTFSNIKKPFNRSGQIDQYLSRSLLNLSRARKNSTLLDPFCGTGGIVLEACLLGIARPLCMDISEEMVLGSKTNFLAFNKCSSFCIARHDASRLPIIDESIDAIATDPPYGRASSTRKLGYDFIVSRFLEEAMRVLKRGSYIVYAGPYEKKPHSFALDKGFKLVKRYAMYVHSSLSREIVVAKKP